MDSLPDYMKICFEALYNFVKEFAFEIENKSGYYSTPQLKKVVRNVHDFIIVFDYSIVVSLILILIQCSGQVYVKHFWLKQSGTMVDIHQALKNT